MLYSNPSFKTGTSCADFLLLPFFEHLILARAGGPINAPSTKPMPLPPSPLSTDGSCTPPSTSHRRKRTSGSATSAMTGHWGLVRPALALILSVFLSSCATLASAGQQDGNAPWGTGRPPREFRMWWRDPSNVLDDLEQFSALYVRAHGCM